MSKAPTCSQRTSFDALPLYCAKLSHVGLLLASGLFAVTGCSGKTNDDTGEQEASALTTDSIGVDSVDTTVGEVEDTTKPKPIKDTPVVENPVDGTPATGITVEAISINQAVEIALATEREFVAKDARNAPVIGGRGALVRAMWTLDASFEARELEARLVMKSADGTEKAYAHKRMVSGPSVPSEVDGGFSWIIPPNELEGDAEYYVAVYEVSGGADPGTTDWRLPADGYSKLEGTTELMLLDIVMVPTCDHEQIPEEMQERYRSYLYLVFPVNEVNLTFHDPVKGGCSIDEATWTTMPKLRTAELAPPWQYYNALVIGGGYGLAQFGDQETALWKDAQRCLSTDDYWWPKRATFELFAHEVGHITGRPHTFDGTAFPYEDCGPEGVWGFGAAPGEIHQECCELIDAQALMIPPVGGNCEDWSDLMSYTYPYFVSDYNYSMMAEVIAEMSSWKTAGLSADDMQGVTLTGGSDVVTGDVHWGVTRGSERWEAKREATALHSATFYDAKGVEVGQYPVNVHEWHADPSPNFTGEGADFVAPIPIDVFTISLPDGIPGSEFELQVAGERKRYPLQSLKDVYY